VADDRNPNEAAAELERTLITARAHLADIRSTLDEVVRRLDHLKGRSG
jgi:hypothetical protein